MKNSKKGFTLIELIVVVVVLAVLAVVAVPMISDWTAKAETSAAETNANTIELAVKAYMAEEGIKPGDANSQPGGHGGGAQDDAAGLGSGGQIGGGVQIGGGEHPNSPELMKFLPKFGMTNPIPNSKSDYLLNLNDPVTVTVKNPGTGEGRIYTKGAFYDPSLELKE